METALVAVDQNKLIFGMTEQQLYFFVKVFVAIALLAIVIKLRFRGGVCRIKKDLSGKVAVVTGGYEGIGRQTIMGLVQMNCKVIFGSRQLEKNQVFVKQIKQMYPKAEVETFKLDLASKESIEQFAKNVLNSCFKIDFMINNAGVFRLPQRRLTKEGFEMQIGVNHFGHFYLNSLLWKNIKASEEPRVISLSSKAHDYERQAKIDWDDLHQGTKYSPFVGYARSKLCNILYIRQLQRRMNEAEIKNGFAGAVHPGIVWTDLLSDATTGTSVQLKVQLFKVFAYLFYPIARLMMKTWRQGAQTTLYLCLQDIPKLTKGEYYADCAVGQSSLDSKNMEDARRLWKVSEESWHITFDL